ncbi:hypothetical protein [Tardiphaga sp.]|uniref:hypothetical protein n=1 Tax=Tardiphaga sp. TaxID=1926292 RepID=UPI00352A4C62
MKHAKRIVPRVKCRIFANWLLKLSCQVADIVTELLPSIIEWQKTEIASNRFLKIPRPRIGEKFALYRIAASLADLCGNTQLLSLQHCGNTERHIIEEHGATAGDSSYVTG